MVKSTISQTPEYHDLCRKHHEEIERLHEKINDQVYRISELEYTTALLDVIMNRMNPLLKKHKKMSYPELGREMHFLCSSIEGFGSHIGN